jgi:hypothetical protein
MVPIGVETADMLVNEARARHLRDGKAIARYADLTGSPDESGRHRREKGLARASRLRTRQSDRYAGATRYAGVKSSISYQSRETEGTQTPVETLDRGWGSCRDLAMLLIEAARRRGICTIPQPTTATRCWSALGPPMLGPTSTFPGAGWIAYDPTNGTVNGSNLIRVAATRDISQAVPVAGSFVGAPGG